MSPEQVALARDGVAMRERDARFVAFGYAEPRRSTSPFDGAAVSCHRYGHRPCQCESCDPARHAEGMAVGRVAVMQAMLNMLPQQVALSWRVRDDSGRILATPGDERYFLGKARAVSRDSDSRYVWHALQALADTLERMMVAK